MTKRSRFVWYGSAAALVLAGVIAAVIGGNVGLLISFVLIGLGLVLATSLVFLEVGLGEDRDRAAERDLARRQRSLRPPGRTRQGQLDRSRGRRRRLR